MLKGLLSSVQTSSVIQLPICYHITANFNLLNSIETEGLLFGFILQTFTEELNSPLSETQTTKSPWKEPPDVEDKKECPRCLESCRAKIENYYTSFKSFLAKNDLSYFIEMSSRVFFPLTYMAFIAYFFGKYGIWRCVLLNVSLATWVKWASEDITSSTFLENSSADEIDVVV